MDTLDSRPLMLSRKLYVRKPPAKRALDQTAGWTVRCQAGAPSFLPIRKLTISGSDFGPSASRRGRDKVGFSQKGHTSHTFCNICFQCARVATCCHIFVTFWPHIPATIHYGEWRRFCNDPVCPDPVWKLSTGEFPTDLGLTERGCVFSQAPVLPCTSLSALVGAVPAKETLGNSDSATSRVWLYLRRIYSDNGNRWWHITFTEFITGQTTDLLNPRNHGMSAAKRDNDNEMDGLPNRWICLHNCMCCYRYVFLFPHYQCAWDEVGRVPHALRRVLHRPEAGYHEGDLRTNNKQ